jgi:hypothetical protein
MVQRPVRQAAKRANVFIQQQQSATPYMTQTIPHRPTALTSQYSNSSDSNHHIPMQHHRIIVADDELEKRDGLVKSVEAMHYCPSIDSYPTVVVTETPYHIVTDEHISYRGANYIYETNNYSSPYYSVSFDCNFLIGTIVILHTKKLSPNWVSRRAHNSFVAMATRKHIGTLAVAVCFSCTTQISTSNHFICLCVRCSSRKI